MSFISALILYSSSLLFGYLLATSIGLKNFWEKFSTGWLLGTGLMTYVSFLAYDVLGWRFTPTYTLVELVILVTICVAVSVYYQKFSLAQAKDEMRRHMARWQQLSKDKVILLLLLMILVPLIFTTVQNIHWPVLDWDALALYDFRAKVIAQTGGLEDGIIRGYFLHYPLYTSLLHAYSYMFGTDSARTWYTLFYLISIVTFYQLLLRHTPQKQALLGAFLLAVSPRIFQHSQMTYTNLPHAMYLAFGYMYLWEWWHGGRRVDLLVGAALIAFSTWVRLTEPLWIPAFGILVWGALKWRALAWQAVAAGIFIYVVRVPWIQYVAVHDHLFISNPFQIGQGFQFPNTLLALLTRLEEVTRFFWLSIYPLFSEYSPALVIGGLYLMYREKWVDLMEYAFFLLLVLFIFGGIFLFSFQFKGWQDIPDSAARMAMFLSPLALYLVMKSDLWQVTRPK